MARPKVFVSRVIPQPALDLLRSHCDVELNESDQTLPPPELRRRLADKQGLVCLLTDPVKEDALSTPGLRCVANVAVGYDNIDVAAATARGVLVTNTPGVLTETVADFAFALLMAAARRVAEADRYTRAGKYEGWGLLTLLGVDVHGKTLGLVGFGRIGASLALRASGFGMRVLYSDVNPAPPDMEAALKARRVSLPEVLEQADFVSLHVPLLPSTRHLIGEKELARMKPTAVLVNTSRGAVVDEKALVAALKERRIFAAGLDVYEDEPALAPGLAELDNVVLAPHIASASTATRTRMAVMAAENMAAALSGKRPANLVNPEAFQVP